MKQPFEGIVVKTRQDQLRYEALYHQWAAACHHRDASYFMSTGAAKAAAHHQDLARTYAQAAMDATNALLRDY